MGPSSVTHRGTAGDWHALLWLAFNVPLHAGTQRAVERRPHIPFPVDLVPDSAVLHLLHLHIGQTLLAALVAAATPRPRTALPAHHRGIFTGAGGAVVVFEGGAVLIDLTVEEAATQGQVEHLPLTKTLGAALSGRGVAKVGGAGEDRTHLPDAESPPSSASASNTRLPLGMELLSLFVQTTFEDTARARWTALLWVDLGVLAVDDTLHLCFSDDTFLTSPGDTRLRGAGPGGGAGVGSAIQLTAFTPLTAGPCLLDHQSTVLRYQGTLLLLAVRLALQTDASDAGVVRDVGDVQHFSLVLAAGFCTCYQRRRRLRH